MPGGSPRGCPASPHSRAASPSPDTDRATGWQTAERATETSHPSARPRAAGPTAVWVLAWNNPKLHTPGAPQGLGDLRTSTGSSWRSSSSCAASCARRCRWPSGRRSDVVRRVQPPIADIGRDGCRKPGSSMPWPGLLRVQRRPQPGGELARRSAPARIGAAQVGLLAGEQAVADLAVGGQPDPVAGRRRTAGSPSRSRRPGRGRRRRATSRPARCPGPRRRPASRVNASASRPRISSAVTIVGAVPAVLGVQRHLLDEPQLVAALQRTSAAAPRPRRR